MKDLAAVTARLSDNTAVVPGKRVCLDFGDEGCICLDGIENRVSNAASDPADAVIKVSLADFMALADGSLNGTMAFMQGKVEGDMAAAMQLQSVTSKIKA